ncbi:MAG TPA: hypothetical protein VF605_12365 [Allosphingosinicella sp.]
MLAAALILLAAAAPGEPRPAVTLMTGLPLYWGETGPFDPAARPAASFVDLREDFEFEPLDVLDPVSLRRGRVLFLAQPQRLAPAELAALDAWIRGGGRALILTDPRLTWPSALPPGDIRRAPPVGLLAPLLHHWRLALDTPAEVREVRARWNRRTLLMDAPGRLRGASRGCVVGEEGWTAFCRLGLGRVRVVADADLMRDSLWERADNRAVVGEWLDELAGIRRPPPPPPEPKGLAGRLAALALALAAALAATGLLLRRRRRR